MNKIVVGQVVYVGRTYQRDELPLATEVVLVGKRYFTVKGYAARFKVKDLSHEQTDLLHKSYLKIYLALDEYKNEVEREMLLKKLRRVFNNDKVSLEVLRSVDKIINL